LKLNANNYRNEVTVTRLVAVLCRNEEWVKALAQILMTTVPQVVVCSYALQAIDDQWLRREWRTLLRTVRNLRCWVFALYSSALKPWHNRVGRLLMDNNALWQGDGFEVKIPTAESYDVASYRRPNPAVLLDAFWDFGIIRSMTEHDCAVQSAESGKNVTASQRVVREHVIMGGILGIDTNLQERERMVRCSAVAAGELVFTRLNGGGNAIAPIPVSAPSVGEKGEKENEDMAPVKPAGLLPLTAPAGAAKDGSRLASALVEKEKLGKKVRILEERVAQLEREKAQLSDEHQREVERLGRELLSAMEALRSEKDAEVEQEVRNFEALLLGVHPDTEAFSRDASAGSTPLASRVEAALKRQAELDRKYDTRQNLRKEREQLENMLNRLRTATDEAMQLAPGIPALQREVEARITDINAKLREGGSGNVAEITSVASQMIAFIKGLKADDKVWSKLDEVAAFLDSPVGRGVLTPNEVDTVRAQLEKRRDLCRMTMDSILDMQPQRQSELVAEKCREIMAISNFREEFHATELFIDAYNVIKRDRIWAQMEQNVGGFAQARQDFIARCAALSKMFRRITLVFDSDAITANVEHRDNLTIVYVAKTTQDQNADNYIVERLSTLRENDRERGVHNPRWLVTDDYVLRLRVEECCDAVVLDSTFTNMLRCLTP
jgi:hypothetical protein